MSLRLTGTNVVNYGSFPATANLTSLSVAFTIEVSSFTGFLDYGRVIGQWSNSSTVRAYATGLHADGRVWCILSSGSSYWGGWTDASPITKPGIYRVVIRATGMGGGTQTLEFWVNGRLISPNNMYWGTGAISGLNATPEILQLGYQASENTNVTPGTYSEVAIWGSYVPDGFCRSYGSGAELPYAYPNRLLFYAPLSHTTTDLAAGKSGLLTGPNYGFASSPSTRRALDLRNPQRPISEHHRRQYLGSESPTNLPPRVYAGPDQTIPKYTGVAQTTLAGSATDRNGDSLTYLWEKVSGPGTVVFTDDTDPGTTVTFSAAGTYVLRLTADDGPLTDSGIVTVTAQQAGQLRISQVVVEASNYNPLTTDVQLRVSQVAVEASNYSTSTPIRASQVVIEAIDADPAPEIRASQIVVEVPTTPQGALTITPDTGALTLVGNQPTVEIGVTITPSTGELTIAGNQPTVVVPVPTRLYFVNVTAPYSPATLRGAWDSTASYVDKFLAERNYGAEGHVPVVIAETSASADYDVLLGRFVSWPLAAQTIEGTLDGYVLAAESNAAADMALHIHVYVTTGDSDTPRGTLLTDYVAPTGKEWASGFPVARNIGAQALSSLSVSAGDRLVVEVGYIARNASATSYEGRFIYGTQAGKLDATSESDWADTNGSLQQSTGVPFLEFSNGILFTASVDFRVSQLVGETSGTPAETRLQVSQLTGETSGVTPSTQLWVSQLIGETSSYTGPVTVEPTTGELVIEGNQPTVVVAGPEGPVFAPGTGALTIQGNTPDVGVGPCFVPSTGALVIDGQQPDVRVNHIFLPQTGALVIEGNQVYAPLYPVGWLVSQVVIEAASKSTASSTAYITQVVSEAVSQAVPPSARAGQVVVEEVSQFPTIYAQVSQVVIEVICAGFVWVDIPDFVRVRLSSIDFPGGSGIVRAWCWARNATTTLRLRLWDITNGRVAGESPEVRQNTPTEVNFDVSIASGTAIYKLQMTANESKVDLFALGTLRKGGSAGGTEYPPVTPPPPPIVVPPVERQHPSWWLEYDASLTGPYSEGCHHLEGAGSVYYYWWVGITTIVNGREGPMKFAGDWGWHYPDDPTNIAGYVSWEAVPGATAYRVYMFNCTSHANGQLFDPHTNYQNLGVAYYGETSPDMYPTVSVHFKEVPASPENYSGIWGIPNATHECIFYSETDGIAWTEWTP